MSLHKGYRGGGRKTLIKEHRITKYLKALDKLIKGEATPEYVKARGEKLVKIKK